MTSSIEQLVTEALSLPEQTRAFLAERLLESLDRPADFSISDEWQAEIQRRCEEIDRGESGTINAKQLFSELRQQLG